MKKHFWLLNFILTYILPTVGMGYFVVIPSYFDAAGHCMATADWNLKTGLYSGFTATWVGATVAFLFSSMILKKSLQSDASKDQK